MASKAKMSQSNDTKQPVAEVEQPDRLPQAASEQEIKRRASENAADLKAGFERIRAAGRALQEARRQFDLGRVS